MRLLILASVLLITFGNYIHSTVALPVSKHSINELNNPEDDSNEPIPSSEVMPGRLLTGKEIQNMVYLQMAKNEEQNKKLIRPKRFIFRNGQRFMRNRMQRMQELLRMRSDRRRLRFQRMRNRQEAFFQALTRQGEMTQQRLQTMYIRTNPALNPQQIRTPNQQIQVTQKIPQTTQAPISTVGTTMKVIQQEPVPTFQQVPLPVGKSDISEK